MCRYDSIQIHVCVSNLCLPGLIEFWFTSMSYGVMMSSREPSSPRPPHSVFIHIFDSSASTSFFSLSVLSSCYQQKKCKNMSYCQNTTHSLTKVNTKSILWDFFYLILLLFFFVRLSDEFFSLLNVLHFLHVTNISASSCEAESQGRFQCVT